MNISYRSKKKIKNLANRFTTNTPILCDKHMPDGLPIDKNTNVDELSSIHPAERFEKIVDEELNHHKHRVNTTDEALRYCIKEDLREMFKDIYFDNGDERSCIKCYKERLNDENSIPIRMVVPDKYDEIDVR